MLVQPPIEELLPKAESRYSLAMLVAKRTRQLVDGAQPMVPETSPNLVTLACEEIVAGKVVGIRGIHTPVEPLRPEIEEARRMAKELAENQAALDSFPDLIDMQILTAKPSDDIADEEDLSDDLAAGDLAEDVIDEMVSEDITDDTEEDIKDLISLDGAETEDAE
jgi:DNA-directed RNA polymerase subunit omega